MICMVRADRGGETYSSLIRNASRRLYLGGL